MNINLNTSDSLQRTAEDICELMDNLGFTSEHEVDADELRYMIIDVILKNLDQTPEECGCSCGCKNERQPGE